MEAQQQQSQPPQETQARKRPDKSRGHRPRAVYTCDACRLRKVKCDGCDGGPGCSHCRRRGESCTWTKGRPRSGPVRGVYVQGYGYGYGNGHGRAFEQGHGLGQGQGPGYGQGLEIVGTDMDARDTSLSSRLARIETLLSEAGWRVSSEQGSRRAADAGTRPRVATTTTTTTTATSTGPQAARSSSVEGDSEAVDDLLATAEHRLGHGHGHGDGRGHGLGQGPGHGHRHERLRDEPDQVHIARHDRFDHQILVSSPDAHPSGGGAAGSSSMASSPVFGSGSEGAARAAAGLDDAFGARAHVFRSRLPARPTCDAVVRLYFARLEWIHHVIHVPSFLAWYEGLWVRHDLGRDDLLMLALLYALLCVTSHFFDLKPGHVHADSDEHHHPPPFEDHDMYRLSYECLVEAEYLRRHSLTAIQTLVMQGLYLVNMGENDTHHANLALAIRMAAALGLSKLDTPGPGPGGGAGTSSAHASLSVSARLHAEMGRRVWWSMVCQDAYTASSCNFSYSIVDGQVKTHLPANLDDEQLLVSNARPLPLDSHATSMSYHIAKIPFALIAKKTVDLFNDDRLDYGAVLALEDELQTQYRALPAYLRPEAADEEGRDEEVTWRSDGTRDDDDDDDDDRQQQLRWQRLFMGITLHNRIMRIYRPMLGHAYNNNDDGGRQRAAKRALVTSAKALMRLVARARQIGFPGLRWWVVLVHVFTAAVVLCVHVHFAAATAAATAAASASHAGLAGEKKEEDEAESVALLRVAVEVLGAAAKRSAAARQAVRLVEMLQMRSRSQLQSSHGARTTRPGETARQHHGYGDESDNNNNSGPSRGQDPSTSWQDPQQQQQQQQQAGQHAMSPWHASRAMAPAPSIGNSGAGNNGAGGDNDDDDDARGWMDLDWSSLLGHAPRPGPVPVANSQASVSSSSSSSADPALLGSGISGLNQDLWETIEAFATSSSSSGLAAPAAPGTAAFVPTAFGGF